MSVKGYELLEPLTTKAPTEVESLSVQERATKPVTDYTGIDVFLMSMTGALAPAWWSTARDRYLSREWPRCPMFSGAAFSIAVKLATIPPIIEARDPSMARDRALAERYTMRLYEGSEFGRGYIELAERWLRDRFTQDNGAFAEVIGDGPKDGPIRGPALGLANLDPSRCSRTGNPEFPVVYTREDGKKFKLHRTRVIFGAQQPSTKDEMNSIGLCWFSRALDFSMSILDDLIYKQEKLGRRPKRAILVGKKMSVDQVKAAFTMADEAADNASLTRASLFPVVANPNASDVGIDVVDLASLPDGFDWSIDVNICAYALGLTGGFPVRWIWPATIVGASKADAMIQHMTGAMSGTAYELNTLANLLGGYERGMRHQVGKFLPPTLKIRFDVQDDWIDEIQAGIQNTRSQRYERNVMDGAISIRVTREQMLATGEITEAQFNEMELEAGRTSDGLPVDTLFYGDNPYLKNIDPQDYTEEQVEEALVTAKRASIQEPGQEAKQQAREAVAALEWLLEEEEEESEPEPQPKPAGQSASQTQETQAEGEGSEEQPQEGVEEQEKGKTLYVKQNRRSLERGMTEELGTAFSGFQGEAADDIENDQETDYSRWQKTLLGILMAWLIKSFLAAITALEDETGISFDQAELTELAQEWATGHGTELTTELIERTRGVIDKARQQYRMGRLTTAQLIAILAPAFSLSRAELIAVSEITRATSAATSKYSDMLKAMNLIIEDIWETQKDELVCEICAPLDEQPKEVWETEFPDGPPCHGRCRCKRRLRIRKA